MSEYKDLEIFQNDEIIKDDMKNRIDEMELVMVELFSIIEDNEIKKCMYENLTEIKVCLMQDWLNLSLIYNRVSVIYNSILDEVPKSNYDEYFRQTGAFVKIQKYVWDILKSSWIYIESLDYYNEYSDKVEKIIYSN